MSSSTIDEIINIQKKRADRQIELKSKHLSLAKEKILTYANFGKKECIYIVPQFLVGYSPYDVSSITKSVYKSLKKERFLVNILTNECLYISWDINKLYK